MMKDLPQLLEIENQCFPKEEAATEDAFIRRIQQISDSFFVAVKEGKLVGLINGPVIADPYISDNLFAEIQSNPEIGGHQSVLGLAVHPGFQNRGIARALLTHLEESASKKKRKTVTLTCKDSLIGFYEALGYRNEGVSESEHGGVIWYNLTKQL